MEESVRVLAKNLAHVQATATSLEISTEDAISQAKNATKVAKALESTFLGSKEEMVCYHPNVIVIMPNGNVFSFLLRLNCPPPQLLIHSR